MKRKAVSIVVLAAIALLAFASVAHAGTSSTTMAIIKDAQDNNRLDGNWTAAQVRAALAAVKSDPALQQYTDVEGVLEDYLASLASPGVAGSGDLMFTGGPVLWLFALGAGLVVTGLALRRRGSEA
jgi:hypothetical protein